MSDDLLTRFSSTPLLDPYDVYERLMTYWSTVMHDDVFLVMNEGWIGAAKPRPARIVGYDANKKPKFEEPDIQIGTGAKAERFVMDLLPPAVVIAHSLAADQVSVSNLTIAADEAAAALEAFLEEHANEEGLLAGAMEDDKASKALATARLKEAKREGTDPEEVEALERLLVLYGLETTARKKAKDAQRTLDLATLECYDKLGPSDIKHLVLDAKWRATIQVRVMGELASLSLALVARIRELGQRYGETLEELSAELTQLDDRVSGYLAEMGIL